MSGGGLIPEILIIGIGNVYRSDDAVGIMISRMLAKRKIPGIRIVEQSGEGGALIQAWQNAQAVIIADAVSSGKPPGTVFRLNASTERIPLRFFNYSTHAFSLAEGIELSRELGELPPYCIIYGIEGKNFTFGEVISVELSNTLESVAENIVSEIQTIKTQLQQRLEYA